MVPTVEWKNGSVRLLDQTRLPEQVEFLDCRDYQTVADAIRTLKVRGAPAIGVAAALASSVPRVASAQSAPTKTPMKLTFWTWENPQQRPYQHKRIQQYMQQFPNISVEFQYFTFSDLGKKVTVGYATGTAPDGFATIGGYPITSTSSTAGTGGILSSRRGATRTISAERALDLCRAEVHTRGERDYGLRNLDITAVGVDTSQGRRNWITGTFTDSSGTLLRGSGYRFNCSVDYSSGQVGAVEILRADGSTVQPGTTSGA